MRKIPVILFCIALGYSTGFAQTGNVGVGNNTPVAKLDVAGDLALREGTAIPVSGSSPTVPVTLSATAPENSFYRITGAPTGIMTLNSISNGVDGQIITLVNATSIKLKISNTNSAGGILTSGGAATIIAPNGSVTLQYSSSAARWFVTNAAGATITDWTKATTADEPAIKTDNQYVTGNVGIGDFSASNPDDNLDIISSSNINGISISGAGTNAAVLKLFDGPTQKGGFGMVPATDAWVKNGVRGDLFVRAETGGKIFFDVSSGGANPTAMMIDKTANGSNVGIGTAVPYTKLDVDGNIYTTIHGNNSQHDVSEQGTTFMGMKSGNTADGFTGMKMQVGAFGSGGILNGSRIFFQTWGNNISPSRDVMTINEYGKVGIGTNIPDAKLEIKGNSSSVGGIKVANASNGAHTWIPFTNGSIYLTGDVGAGTGDIILRSYSGTTYKPLLQAVASNGNILIGDATTNTNPYILPAAAGVYLRVGSTASPVQDLTSNFVYVNNRVHIGGTSSSDFPLFVEGSSVSTSIASLRGSYWNTSNATSQGAYGPNTDISAKFIGRVWATTSFEVSSDKRIKNIIGKTNNANDLTTLKQIEIVDYTMKDKIADGNREFKKVIAQDVAKVYPAVVTYSTDFVPDIFALYPIRYNENLATVSLDKSLGIKVGDKIRLINELNAKIDVQVISVADGAFSFVIPDNINRDSANIFVYGREVHDKALVDYDGLTTLNISATQELAKQLETAKAEIELLKKQNEALKTTKAGTEEVDQLKAQIDELKKLILNTGLKAENK